VFWQGFGKDLAGVGTRMTRIFKRGLNPRKSAFENPRHPRSQAVPKRFKN
jgi:hypothetical protein